ncbi:unnamed protein product [Prorocentrum cordatum]|uniref:Uncharacterized protein n=1 Tax=Prorocentrum cordatum TaxID=2364126 RepID=A0ABN9VEW2_9DINO|nr:unnamed protein product [Polarella glacialis]
MPCDPVPTVQLGVCPHRGLAAEDHEHRPLGARGLAAPNLAGPVDGLQTAQRAEVTAAVAAARVVGGPIAASADPRDGEHADLWHSLVDAVRSGRLRARWVPAHKTPAEAHRLGLSERDRLGNAAANGNAGAAAASRAPPPDVVRARCQELQLLEAAQRVMAAAQQAALAAAPPAARRRQRDWRRVRRGARARAASALAADAPAGQVAQAPACPRRSGAVAPVSSGGMLAAFFAGRSSWWPHALARGPCHVFCLRSSGSATSAAGLLGNACPGWRERLPARCQAALLLGELPCAGGSAEAFACLAAQRIAQLPKVPD